MHFDLQNRSLYISTDLLRMNFFKDKGLTMTQLKTLKGVALFLFIAFPTYLFAHGVTAGDQGYIQEISGNNFLPFIYLGAKHMVSGYDHLLFLFGVIFFLYKLKDVGIYVSLFAVGHSTTLLIGVFGNININSYLIDAIIGLSVVYKALDNIGAFKNWFGIEINTKVATFIFGLFHGFGLAAKILEFEISPEGLLGNLIAFNVGVEIGQTLALSAILIIMGYWRRSASFIKHAYSSNLVLMLLGLMLFTYQIFNYVSA